MAKKKKGSDQHLWKEISINPEFFSAKHAYSDELSKEEIQALQEAKMIMQVLLCDRVFEIASESFTEHQMKVFAISQIPDKTYNDIAKMLERNYTAVSHAIKGIKSPQHGKHHGGFETKLKRICSTDSECCLYLDYLYKLRTEDPQLAIEVIRDYDEDPEYWKTFEF